MSYSALPYSQYVSASTQAKAAIGFLVASIITSSLSIFVAMANAAVFRNAIGGIPSNAADAAAMENRALGLAYIQAIVFVTTVIAFLMWVYRANRAARSFGVAYMEFMPGWAVGWWFIPFLNLVRPYQVMVEIWKASSPDSLDATSWQAERNPPIILTWWLTYLLAGLLAYAIFRPGIGMNPTLEDSLQMTYTGMFSDFGDIIAGILAILLVAGINQRQERKRMLLQSAAALGGQAAGYSGAYQPVYGTMGYGAAGAPAGYGQAAPMADPVAHYNRGVGYYQANDMARAIEEYNEAIRLSPNFAEAHYSLGVAYLAMGNTDAATIQASRLQSFSPDWSNKLYQLIRGR